MGEAVANIGQVVTTTSPYRHFIGGHLGRRRVSQIGGVAFPSPAAPTRQSSCGLWHNRLTTHGDFVEVAWRDFAPNPIVEMIHSSHTEKYQSCWKSLDLPYQAST